MKSILKTIVFLILFDLCSAYYYYSSSSSSGSRSSSSLVYIIVPVITAVFVIALIIICCKKKYARARAINMMPMGAPIALVQHNNPYAPPGLNPYGTYSQPPPYDPPKVNTQVPLSESAPPPYTAPSASSELTSRT